jgi:histidyl-tRNA synthetase
MVKALRGMKDILDVEESGKFTHFIETATRIAQNYGFCFIETPKLEETALFKRSVGESSDIVGKEMYQFIDKGENDVCLRPEGTAGVVRAFVERKLDRIDQTRRFFYHGSMFRYERPQKGRLREFHQFGCEVFGEASVYEDANLIIMLSQIFKALEISHTIEINSLGCQNCIPEYKKKLVEFLDAKHDHLCDDCLRRKETNPIRTLDCKTITCAEQYGDAPFITDHLCESCAADFETLKALLAQNNIAFQVNKKLVRGLDYYTQTAFEFVSTEIGAQSAIAGGGRYDRLVEFLEGRPTPAVGFAIGIERIFDLIKLPDLERTGIYLGAMDEAGIPVAFKKANELRAKECVTFDYNARSLKAHLKQADKANARICAVIGEEELKNRTIWVKDLKTKAESTLPLDSL